MKTQIKNLSENTFYYLLIIYAVLVILISLKLFWKYTIHIEILALIIAILGISIISKQDETKESKNEKQKLNKKLHYALFTIAILFIILLRVLPYLNNSIPLGYDPGLYKYGIESGLQNKDLWILSGGMEPGFLYLMKPLSFLFSTQFILTYLLIFFCVILGLAVYFATKEYFDKKTALIALLVYAVSIIQFKTFWYMYYKNIIGLSLALFSIYFYEKSKKSNNKYYTTLFIILAGFLGAVHRPTFYIFGISYFLYTFISPYKINEKYYNLKELKLNIIYGLLILIIALSFYLGKFRLAIISIISPVLHSFVETGDAPGTFINFFQYQFSTLSYLPFAILGFFCLIKRKKFNMLFFWALITAIIVYFQFFFFNRFIIHLDIILIILSALGFSILIENKKKLGFAILAVMLFSAVFVSYQESTNAKPLISENALNLIQKLNQTPEDSYAMSLSSEYSPWVLAYSGRKNIAPGLFDDNLWSEDQWNIFWTTQSKEETIALMSSYDKPVYLFAGNKSFNNSCFSPYIEESGEKIYKYDC